MASSSPSGASIFEQLRNPNSTFANEQKQREEQRLRKEYEAEQKRLFGLVETNSTLPCTINSITILGAENTRPSFLAGIFDPIVKKAKDRPYTLTEALREVSIGASKLQNFDIFEQPISLYVDKPDPSDPSTSPTDINIYLQAKEKQRLSLKAGTYVGNAEGTAETEVGLRNLFGGAEKLSFNASFGTRTRSAYLGTFQTPVLSNPALQLELGGLASTTSKSWASHEEAIKQGWGKLSWLSGLGHRHVITYSGAWRQVTGLGEKASATVRGDAGDSAKSSISHSWTRDRRDNPLLPSSGVYTKIFNELAGWGPLQGDVAFWKSEVESQAAVPVPIPFMKRPSGISITTSLRAGLLHPLALGSGNNPTGSRINDRFMLGGPTDVRGFRMSGLGPRDGADGIGGDIYAAGSANIFFPLPRVGADKPFRLQAFINGGRLLALRKPAEGQDWTTDQVSKNVRSTIAGLGDGLPTTSVGFGLVYAHPVARFELNFSLPLIMRKGEDARKGLQFGIGINML